MKNHFLFSSFFPYSIFFASVFRLIVFSASVFRLIVFSASVFRLIVFSASVFRLIVFSASVFRLIVFSASVFRPFIFCASMLLIAGLLPLISHAQDTIPLEYDTLKTKCFFRQHLDDSTMITNQDAIFNRPFIGLGGTQTAVGGYLEGNTNYFSEDGISDGFSMELRRFNVFLYSTISQRIKFLSEIEFEHGVEEINVETAQIDVEINPSFIIRGGILLPQVGIFNANHDSPNWEFVERPLSSTRIIPSTLSEVGFGIHGKFFPGNNIISYNAYLLNGLQSGIILNSEGRTFIPSGKSGEMFGEDNNGVPAVNARLAITNRLSGEIGFSYYGGVYNTFRKEGVLLDKRRMVNMYSVDFSGQIEKLTVQGEYVFASVDVPSELTDVYGNKQNGGFVEIIYPFINRPMFSYDNAKISINARLETIDYNYGKFNTTHHEKGDEIWAVAGGLSFRPTPSTVFRTNYRYHWEFDVLGNPPVKIAGIQVGFATYF